jgi:hypothetical protein
MTRRLILTTLLTAAAAAFGVGAAEREWQKGVWREVSVERPRVSFGIGRRDPNSSLPSQASAREIRKYVIDTETRRLELRQDAAASTPHIDALVGAPVVFAVEKKVVYIKDDNGREHKLNLTKQSALQK